MTTPAPLSVLIVDDEAPARSRMQDLLADCALQVPLVVAGEAANGRSALEQVTARPVDVVLLDVRMPEMDGIATLTEIKRIAPQTEVIILTGADPNDAASFECAGE